MRLSGFRVPPGRARTLTFDSKTKSNVSYTGDVRVAVGSRCLPTAD